LAEYDNDEEESNKDLVVKLDKNLVINSSSSNAGNVTTGGHMSFGQQQPKKTGSSGIDIFGEIFSNNNSQTTPSQDIFSFNPNPDNSQSKGGPMDFTNSVSFNIFKKIRLYLTLATLE
jgi:hypothetical protein